MQITDQQRSDFLEQLWNYYAQNGRASLPWRQAELDGSFDPYKIMVSELMLQQTQVGRVIPKYQAFLQQFPNVASLSQAEQGDVLRAWQGLGYNRRAKFLWQAAKAVQTTGRFPSTLEGLIELPGIGKNTAGAILTYAYNQPVVFIETNVRTVYIHHFFQDHDQVDDKELGPLIEATLDREQPREFYWALMDYGSHLKATVGNLSRASKHYAKQSKFHGSLRQIRGQIIRELGIGPVSFEALEQSISDPRLAEALNALTSEGLIRQMGDSYSL